MAAAQGALIGDGEAVRFLLDLPDEGKNRGVGVQVDLMALGGDEGACTVAVVLDHAENRHVQSERRADLLRDRGVRHAAVDEEHVGQRRKFLVAVGVALQAAGQDLLHGGVVVGVLRDGLRILKRR